jgi:hypothetical protein
VPQVDCCDFFCLQYLLFSKHCKRRVQSNCVHRFKSVRFSAFSAAVSPLLIPQEANETRGLERQGKSQRCHQGCITAKVSLVSQGSKPIGYFGCKGLKGPAVIFPEEASALYAFASTLGMWLAKAHEHVGVHQNFTNIMINQTNFITKFLLTVESSLKLHNTL